MKLGDLISSIESINEILKVSLPAKVAFRFALAVKKADSEIQAFNKTREEKIKEYGDVLEDGSSKVKEENLPTFIKEVNAMLDQEVTIEGFIPMSIEEFGDAKIEPRHLMNLDWLITA